MATEPTDLVRVTMGGESTGPPRAPIPGPPTGPPISPPVLPIGSPAEPPRHDVRNALIAFLCVVAVGAVAIGVAVAAGGGKKEHDAAAISPSSTTATDSIVAVPTTLAASPTTLAAGYEVTRPTVPLALADPCRLLTPAQTAPIAGDAKPVRTTVGDGTADCGWHGQHGSIGIQAGDSVALFRARIKDTPQAYSGLGDEAYVDPEFAGKVLVRKGNRWIWVFAEYTNDDRNNTLELARAVLPEI